MHSGSAGIIAYRITLYTHRISFLEHFGWSVPRVGHVRMACGWTITGAGRAATTGDGFVVGKWKSVARRILSAKRKIIHGALAGCGNSLRGCLGQGPWQRVYYALGSFDVATCYSCGG